MTITFHRIWFGGTAIPDAYEAYWNAWQRQFPSCEFRTWTDQDMEGLELSRPALERLSSSVCKADLARYEILYKFGGIYLDCDIMPYQHFCPEDFVAQLTVCNETESPEYCSIGFIGAPKGHALFLELIDHISNSHIDEMRPNISTGPWLFGRHLENYPHRRLPPAAFYPYLYDEPQSSTWARSLASTFGIHIWGGSWLPEDLRKQKAIQMLNKGDTASCLEVITNLDDQWCKEVRDVVESIRNVRNKCADLTMRLGEELSVEAEDRAVFEFGKVVHWLMKQDPNRMVWQIGAADGILVDPVRSAMINFDPPAVLLEPNPYLFRRLQQSYAKNLNARLVEAAYGSEEGELVLNAVNPAKVAEHSLPDWVNGLSSAYDDRNALGGLTIDEHTTKLIQQCVEHISVPVMNFCAVLSVSGQRHPDVLVVDAEGMDQEIIEDIINNDCRPAIIHFEIHCLDKSSTKALIQRLSEDYTVFEFGNDMTAYRNDLVLEYAKSIYVYNGSATIFTTGVKRLHGLN